MSDSKQMTSLIRHARRQMSSIRANRANFATPKLWSAREAAQMRQRATQQADYAKVDRRQAATAARWAVADARRDINPNQARLADRDLNDRYGVDPSTLAYERDLAYQQGQRDADRRAERRAVDRDDGSVAPNLVAATAAMVVSAELYEHASDWDEMSAESVDATMDAWDVPEDNVTDVSHLPEVDAGGVEAGDQVDQVEQIEQAQIPEGLFPYSIEDQMAHVADNGNSAQAPGAAEPEMGTGAEMGAAPAAS